MQTNFYHFSGNEFINYIYKGHINLAICRLFLLPRKHKYLPVQETYSDIDMTEAFLNLLVRSQRKKSLLGTYLYFVQILELDDMYGSMSIIETQVTKFVFSSLLFLMRVNKEMATQCFCLGNPMDRGAWQVVVHGITQTLVFLLRKPHGKRGLADCCPSGSTRVGHY